MLHTSWHYETHDWITHDKPEYINLKYFLCAFFEMSFMRRYKSKFFCLSRKKKKIMQIAINLMRISEINY
jgi:hypothetical protein